MRDFAWLKRQMPSGARCVALDVTSGEACLAVMGPKGAVEILYRAEQGDPEKIKQRVDDYQKRFASPFAAAERGYIDEVITPRTTRRRLARGLAMLRGKRVEMPARKHDNLPV